MVTGRTGPAHTGHEKFHSPSSGPARLYALLWPDIRGGGYVVKNQRRLGRLFGRCRETINRWFRELVKAGLIRSKTRYRDGWRAENAYRLGRRSQNVTTSNRYNREQESKPPPPLCEESEILPKLGVIGKKVDRSPQARWGRLSDRLDNAQWVVDHFAIGIAKRDGQIKRESYRRGGWGETAVHWMLDQGRDLDEVLKNIDYAFDHTHEIAGQISAVVWSEGLNHWMSWGDGRYRPVKLTRLIQIAQWYDLIHLARLRSEGAS